MPLQLLKYQPGVVKDISEYAAGKNGPFYIDSNLVRFKNGYAEKLGGWLKDQINALDTSGNITSTATSIEGIARRMVFWRSTTDGEDRIAVGTHNHLLIIENGAVYDITPLRDRTDSATTTTEALDDSETAIDLASVTGFKAAGAILIGTEVITYTGISTLTLTGCTRGADSTTAAAHDSGAVATQILIDPITTADESTTVTITDTAHGAQTSDWVVLSGAAATGGVAADDLNSMAGYQVTVLTANTYTITVPSAATSTVSAGGGNAVVIQYLVGIAGGLGSQSADPALGWGVGSWGESTWGTARSASSSDVSLDNSSWNLSIWSEDLIATVRNASIFYWDTSAGTNNRAVLVSSIAGAESVPTVARITTVSFPDRHFIVGGSQEYVIGGGTGNVDDMLVRWSTQEDFTKFAPTATNTAGDQRLQIGTKIVAMVAAREETLISTDSALYGMTFTGGSFVFSFRLLGTDCGAAGINTMINVDSTVYYMGRRNFFVYDGILKELACPVQYYVFDRMQERYIDKVVVGHNKAFKEITWFYVSNDNTATTNPENDSYVTYNYAENAWTIGTMDRTVWSDSFGARTVPFAFDPDGFLYNHETGTSDNGAAMNSFIEAAPREISAEGETLYMVDQIVPDANMSATTSLDLYMNTRKYPNSTEVIKGPFTITSSTDKVSTRAKGRQIAIKFQSTGTEDQWTLGDFRINSRQDGLR
jgi:hypothetical protein